MRTHPKTAEDAHAERASLRAAVVLGVLTLGIPLGLFALFERQARRLDALADHGASVLATVTDLRTTRGEVFAEYAFEVDGRRHGWTVSAEETPGLVGSYFAVSYLPEDPSFSRPGDRSLAAIEAASNRAFTHRLLLGIVWFFGVFTLAEIVELVLLRRVGSRRFQSTEYLPYRMRRRLAFAAMVLIPLLVVVFSWHLADAAARGESGVGVAVGIVLSLAVLAGSLFYALRDGPAHAQDRGRRMIAIAAPIAVGAAVLRALAMLFAS